VNKSFIYSELFFAFLENSNLAKNSTSSNYTFLNFVQVSHTLLSQKLHRNEVMLQKTQEYVPNNLFPTLFNRLNSNQFLYEATLPEIKINR